jgi:hypothetical protein
MGWKWLAGTENGQRLKGANNGNFLRHRQWLGGGAKIVTLDKSTP